MQFNKKSFFNLSACLLLLYSNSSLGNAEVNEISYWVISSGGVIQTSKNGELVELSGTLGQWETTSANFLRGGEWEVGGGFWFIDSNSLPEEKVDSIFQDSFDLKLPKLD